MRYRFDNFALDTDLGELRRGTHPVPVEPQVFDLLLYLIRNRDRLVSKDDLLESVWRGRVVSKSALNTRIHLARCAVDDNGEDQRLIKTWPRKGIRFVGSVLEEPAPTEEVPGRLGRADKIATRRPAAPILQLPDRPSIAVLPFTNLGGDPNEEYLGDGIVEDIITELSRFSDLFVIARNSSFQYKGKSVDVRQVGCELGVGYVLEGSLRRSFGSVRISAQLIDTQTGAHRWAERYDRKLEDVFAVQAELARTIASVLVAHVNKAEVQHTLLKRPSSWQAHDFYMRAAASFTTLFWAPAERLHETRHFLERSLSIDRQYARSLALLANTYVIAWHQPWGDDFLNPAALERASELARKAVQADPNLPQAHAQLGWALGWRGEHDRSIVEFERAIALNPNFTGYHFGGILVLAGELDRAIAVLRSHMRLDPFYLPMAPGFLGLAYYLRKEHAQALQPLRESVAGAANLRGMHVWLAATHAQLGQSTEAHAAAAEALRIDPTYTITGTSRILMRFKYQEHAEHFFDGLRKAGLPED